MSASNNWLRSWSPAWAHWYRRVLPAYWVFLFALTHLPRLQIAGPEQSDTLAHFGAFGMLAFLYWRFAETLSRPRPVWFVWQAAVVLTLWAGVDEYLQQFVDRTPDLADWIADVAGIGLVLGGLELRRRWVARGPSGPVGRVPPEA